MVDYSILGKLRRPCVEAQGVIQHHVSQDRAQELLLAAERRHEAEVRVCCIFLGCPSPVEMNQERHQSVSYAALVLTLKEQSLHGDFGVNIACPFRIVLF